MTQEQNDIYIDVILEIDPNLLKEIEKAMLPNETLSDTVNRLLILGFKAEGITP